MRIVLDTNVLLSAIISAKGGSAELLARCQTGELELLISPDSIMELRRVLTYPKVSKRLQYSNEQIDRFITFLEQTSIVMIPPLEVRAVPDDSDDDKFVALALAGEAQYIISGDNQSITNFAL
jgi:uncharacterized protein